MSRKRSASPALLAHQRAMAAFDLQLKSALSYLGSLAATLGVSTAFWASLLLASSVLAVAAAGNFVPFLRLRSGKRRKQEAAGGIRGSMERRKEEMLTVAGLNNPGNNCFINAILQALASCDVVVNHLEAIHCLAVSEQQEHQQLREEKKDHSKSPLSFLPRGMQQWVPRVILWRDQESTPNARLTEALLHLLKELRHPITKRHVASPRGVMKELRGYKSHFDFQMQQDASEALLFLEEGLAIERSQIAASLASGPAAGLKLLLVADNLRMKRTRWLPDAVADDCRAQHGAACMCCSGSVRHAGHKWGAEEAGGANESRAENAEGIKEQKSKKEEQYQEESQRSCASCDCHQAPARCEGISDEAHDGREEELTKQRDTVLEVIGQGGSCREEGSSMVGCHGVKEGMRLMDGDMPVVHGATDGNDAERDACSGGMGAGSGDRSSLERRRTILYKQSEEERAEGRREIGNERSEEYEGGRMEGEVDERVIGHESRGESSSCEAEEAEKGQRGKGKGDGGGEAAAEREGGGVRCMEAAASRGDEDEGMGHDALRRSPLQAEIGSFLECAACGYQFSVDVQQQSVVSLPLASRRCFASFAPHGSLQDSLLLFSSLESVDNVKCPRCCHAAASHALLLLVQKMMSAFKVNAPVEESLPSCKARCCWQDGMISMLKALHAIIVSCRCGDSCCCERIFEDSISAIAADGVANSDASREDQGQSPAACCEAGSRQPGEEWKQRLHPPTRGEHCSSDAAQGLPLELGTSLETEDLSSSKSQDGLLGGGNEFWNGDAACSRQQEMSGGLGEKERVSLDGLPSKQRCFVQTSTLGCASSCPCRSTALQSVPGFVALKWPQVRQQAKKRLLFMRPPEVLCLHLQRVVYSYAGYPVKLEGRVDFDDILDLSPFTFAAFVEQRAVSRSHKPSPRDAREVQQSPLSGASDMGNEAAGANRMSQVEGGSREEDVGHSNRGRSSKSGSWNAQGDERQSFEKGNTVIHAGDVLNQRACTVERVGMEERLMGDTEQMISEMKRCDGADAAAVSEDASELQLGKEDTEEHDPNLAGLSDTGAAAAAAVKKEVAAMEAENVTDHVRGEWWPEFQLRGLVANGQPTAHQGARGGKQMQQTEFHLKFSSRVSSPVARAAQGRSPSEGFQWLWEPLPRSRRNSEHKAASSLGERQHGGQWDANSRGLQRFQLAAVVVHYGDAYGGHYVVYRRVVVNSETGDGRASEIDMKELEDVGADVWFQVSDRDIRRVSFKEVMCAQASMLFYCRLDTQIK